MRRKEASSISKWFGSQITQASQEAEAFIFVLAWTHGSSTRPIGYCILIWALFLALFFIFLVKQDSRVSRKYYSFCWE